MFYQLLKDQFRGIYHPRSPHWSAIRNAHVLAHPNCAACNKASGIEAHHKIPFHIDPDLELEPSNLISLCRRCHYLIGHLDNWKSFNAKVLEDSGLMFNRIQGRP